MRNLQIKMREYAIEDRQSTIEEIQKMSMSLGRHSTTSPSFLEDIKKRIDRVDELETEIQRLDLELEPLL